MVKKAETGDLLMAYCSNEVVMYGEMTNFGIVISSIGRLIRVVQGVR